MIEDYDIVIGLEVHAELKTKTKVFCSCRNEFGDEPNSNCCPVCVGLPGALPIINKKAVELTIMAGLTIGSSFSEVAVFERKNYFYPDLAKSYQISQLEKPICVGGQITLDSGKNIRINRIHLEEDAGKLIHKNDRIGTLIDYNRGGVPLIEMVTEPDISSGAEAVEFLTKYRSLLMFAGVADCKMEQGGLRCDVNLSVKRKGQKELGTRTEMKNLNSFKAVARAIDYEISRQIETIENGGKIDQETRLWDEETQTTRVMRSKEEAMDYRYFPEPDLLKLVITDEEIEAIRQTMPESKIEKLTRFVSEYSLPEYDANILCEDIELADYFEKVAKTSGNGKLSANWIMTDVMRVLKDKNITIEEFSISAEHLGEIISLIEKGTISTKIAKELFEIKLSDDRTPEEIVKEKGMVQVADTGAIEAMVDEVIANNPKMVEDYRNSDEGRKPRVIKGLIGQVMKLSKGKANPTLVTEIMTNKLS